MIKIINLMLFGLLVSTSVMAANITISSQQISEGNRFQAISIDKGNIWISGTESALYHSRDGGKSWLPLPTPRTLKKMQYRDIQAINGKLVLMAAGSGKDSRIYVSDSSATAENWRLVKQGSEKGHFYNCMSILDSGEAWLFGDSIGETLFLQHSSDFGWSWQDSTLPANAQPHEGGFAASGTCLNHNTAGMIVIGTGNAEQPRLFKRTDDQWQQFETPFYGGEAAGIFSLQIDGDNIYAFGGGLKQKDQAATAFVFDSNNSTWAALPKLPLKGAVYGSAITKDYIFAVNPQGIAVLEKGSDSWKLLSDLDIWAIDCLDSTCWGVGAKDTVVTLQLPN